uniref:ARAD1D25542p n=1 Tax=Blastobotrys adeninivorans TaxID=409370 RepID=A0A060TAA4_BLAAD
MTILHDEHLSLDALSPSPSPLGSLESVANGHKKRPGGLFPGYCSPTLAAQMSSIPSSNSQSNCTSASISSGPSSVNVASSYYGDFDILAEAAKRAEMSLLTRDFENLSS